VRAPFDEAQQADRWFARFKKGDHFLGGKGFDVGMFQSVGSLAAAFFISVLDGKSAPHEALHQLARAPPAALKAHFRIEH
jgi:hypothetical protein